MAASLSCRAPHTADVHQYVQLLSDCSASSGGSDVTASAFGRKNLASSAGVDEIAQWWAAVVNVGAYWLSGDDEQAERLYPLLDVFPKYLHSSE